MIEILQETSAKLHELLGFLSIEGGILHVTLKFMPFVLFFELPFMALVMFGVTRYWIRTRFARAEKESPYYPAISCVVTCYSEGDIVKDALRALAAQRYPGPIEILAVVDGASQNVATWRAVQQAAEELRGMPLRTVRAIPKWQRGGRVSSSNAGMALARYDILVSLDGDTVLDNDAIFLLSRHFQNPEIVAVGCSLRVRNAMQNPLTAFQALEYMMSIQTTRAGLAEWGVINNISGAFGAFRRSFLQRIGGWDTGSAEDLDLTTRIKSYLGRYPQLRLAFEPMAVAETEAPATFNAFLRQRLRWDGDLFYIYIRKYWRNITPGIMGWRNVLLYCWTGIFFQMLMPFAILAYSVSLFFTYTVGTALSVLGMVYSFYLAMTIVSYAQFLGMLSERPWRDLLYVPLLTLYPFYAFFGRAWSAFAVLSEVFLKTHRDTAMAPWWVLRRNRF